MSIRDQAHAEHARIDGLLTALVGDDGQNESSLFELMEQLTPHLAAHHSVMAPAVRNVLGQGAVAAEVERLDARMRVLVLRIGALWKLGSNKFAGPLSELQTVFREHVALEDTQVVPALESAMDESAFAQLARTMDDKHRTIASAYREKASHARSSAA